MRGNRQQRNSGIYQGGIITMKVCTSEQEFIDAVAPYAQKACKRFQKELGQDFYLPSVLIAQACKENGYGIRSYWDNPGVEALVTYNNMCGIKRSLLNPSWTDIGLGVWPGKYLNKKTPEVYGGKQVIINDDFRIYDDPEQSFVDYLCFMRWGGYSVGNPKYYDKIKNLHDYKSLIKQVHALGYATGPTYSSGIISIIEKHGLTKYDDISKVEPSGYYPSGTKKEEGGTVNSSLTDYTKLSPYNSGQRTHSIDRITPHCVVGQMSVEDMGAWFADAAKCSANYGIGRDGRLGLYVPENVRSWCSSSEANDQRAVTIECACDKNHPYAFNSAVYQKLIALSVDLCKRYGKTKLLWLEGNDKNSSLDDKERTLNYIPAKDEMVLTAHRWFAAKACPGDWMYTRMADLAQKVTAALGGSEAPSGTETLNPSGKIYRIQLGAYEKKENAEIKLRQVSAAGFECFITDPDPKDGYMRVQCGAYMVKANAESKLAAVKYAGFVDAFIKESDK